MLSIIRLQFMRCPRVRFFNQSIHRVVSSASYRQSFEDSSSPEKKKKLRRGYSLLLIPVITFCLGCWQWQRHQWKTKLIARIHDELEKPTVQFPVNNLAALDQMEYRKVQIKGRYLYDHQFMIRWRSRLDGQRTKHPLLPKAENGKGGAQIITPLLLDETDGLIIMVNRGWLPVDQAKYEIENGAKRMPTDVEITAVVRKSEKPNLFMSNQPEKGIWVYKDVQQMAKWCGASPVLVDADFDSNQMGGPIGGQTNANLRNTHFSYMLQWFGTSAATLALWYGKFYRR